MNPEGLKAKLKSRIYNGLKAQFNPETSPANNYNPEADAMWEKMAEAISGIATDIVMEIVQNAEVAPGIPTVGSPVNQTTVAPGKII